MAIFRAEDVYVNVDGTDLAAMSLSFKSAAARKPVRRFGEIVDPTGFIVSGPQQSSMTIDFLLTGSGASIFNPILSLLDGINAEVYNVSGGLEDFAGIYEPYHNTGEVYDTGEVYVQKKGSHFLNYIYRSPWNESISIWYARRPSTENVAIALATGDHSIFSLSSPFTGWDIRKTGFMGCLQGSTISLGGSAFASGAALTSLSINIGPFSPVVCSASFDIYNEVTGVFGTGVGSISIDPSNVAHGLYSTYSGISDNVDEVTSISLSYSAQREPRYEIGKNHVVKISTTSTAKSVNFQGYGRSENLKVPTVPFTITLGSANQSNIFTDTFSGVIVDDSFSIPNVGLISKNISIIQNME